MKSIFLRFNLFLLAFFANGIFAQTYSDGLSDAVVNVNSKKIPVKVFASTNYTTFQNFAAKKVENSLVIVNETNFEAGDESRNQYNQQVLEGYVAAGYQVLDKNFKSSGYVTPDQVSKIKYLLKSPTKITENDQVKLETDYKIWDPAKGLKLGPVTLHFYSLMFILAFGLGYVLMSYIFKIDNVNQKYLEPLFTLTLIGTILGARLGHVIFYQPELFKQDFWSVFLPIQTKPTFKFTGFMGLASHGATIALILTTLYYAYQVIKKNPLWVYDRIGIVVALGGGFVRMGNFFNSEIIGKPVAANSPFAMLFPNMSDEYGLTVPRYPTQLFEAAGYFSLFVLLWILYRYTNKKYQQGWLFGLFFILLWAVRFFVEFLKEPQGDEFIKLGSLNTGQVLSIPFMIAGLVIMLMSPRFKITEAENEKPE